MRMFGPIGEYAFSQPGLKLLKKGVKLAVLNLVGDKIGLTTLHEVVGCGSQIDVVPGFFSAWQYRGEQRRVFQHHAAHGIWRVGGQPYCQQPPRRVSRDNGRFPNYLAHKLSQITTQRGCSIFFWHASGTAVSITIHRKDVITRRQVGQHTSIVLPIYPLPVNEQERRTIVRTFGIVKFAAIDSDLFLDKSGPPNGRHAPPEISQCVKHKSADAGGNQRYEPCHNPNGRTHHFFHRCSLSPLQTTLRAARDCPCPEVHSL